MADIYRIGVNIALTNSVSAVLATIGKDLLGLNSTVNKVNANFGKWATAIGGVAGILGGAAIIGGLIKIAKHGEEVNHQLELMKVSGMQFGEIQEANAAALKATSSVLTTHYSENLRHIRELRYATGDTKSALEILGPVLEANAVLNAVKGGKGGHDEVFELVKSLEIKGLTTQSERANFLSYINAMKQAVIASGGQVTPKDFMSAIKFGRTAALGWDEKFITEYLPRSIQSMKTGAGSGGGTGGPGNALMTMFAKIIQGQLSKTSAEEFAKLGLGTVHHIKGSSQAQLTNVPGLELALRNPYEWVQKYVYPALVKAGKTSQLDVIKATSRMMGVRTASQVLAEYALQGRSALGAESPWEKDARLKRMAMGKAAYSDLILNDPTTALQAFNAQLTNLAETLGAPVWAPGGIAITALSQLTVMLNQMARFAGAHPEGVKLALEALAGLGVGLVVAGLTALAIAIGGIVGVAGGIAAAAAALGTLAALNWANIKPETREMIKSVGRTSYQWVTWIATEMNKFIDAVESGFSSAVDKIAAAVMGMFSRIVDAAKAALNFFGLGGGGGGKFSPGDPWAPPHRGTVLPEIIIPPGGAGYRAPVGPPPSGSTTTAQNGNVYLSVAKVGDVIMDYIAERSARPMEGAFAYDHTRGSPTSDQVISYG